MKYEYHVPVLNKTCKNIFLSGIEKYFTNGNSNEKKLLIIDATLGTGGHSETILNSTKNINILLIGIDHDNFALQIAKLRLKNFQKRIHFVNDNFINLDKILNNFPEYKLYGILFDLGLSNLQLQQDRGFAYSIVNSPLDMRMSNKNTKTAKDILNTYSEKYLCKILSSYGEERFAKRIANKIVNYRIKKKFFYTKDLLSVIYSAFPKKYKFHSSKNPARRTFQALRIEVNNELNSLKTIIPIAINNLMINGRIIFISYNSLEDRIIKYNLKSKFKKQLNLLNKKIIKPDVKEISKNPKSSCAKLRSAEKIQI